MSLPMSTPVVTQIAALKKHKLPIQGFFGETWVADDPLLQTEVVLKELPLTSQAEVDKALNEARRMQQASHRNVAQIRYIGNDATQPIARIVMPLYARGCLEQAMRRSGGSLPIGRALRYTDHVLLALAHTHTRGMIHADIKPSNILIGDDDEGLLTDFGQSVDMLMSGPGAGMAPTPTMYGWIRPPEAFSGLPVDLTADLYQVGVLLYRLINGKRLWKQQLIHAASDANPGMFTDPTTDSAAWSLDDGELWKRAAPQLGTLVAAGRWPVRSLWAPHVPLALRRVIRKAISAAPADRFQSATEMKEALAGVTVPPLIGGCTVRDDADGWTWTHETNDQTYTSTLSYSLGRWEVESLRKNRTTGVSQTLQAHCGIHASQQDALKAVGERFKGVK